MTRDQWYPRGRVIGPTFDGPFPQVQLDARFHGHFTKGNFYTHTHIHTYAVPNVIFGFFSGAQYVAEASSGDIIAARDNHAHLWTMMKYRFKNRKHYNGNIKLTLNFKGMTFQFKKKITFESYISTISLYTNLKLAAFFIF